MTNTFVSTDQDLIEYTWLCAALKAEYWGWNLDDEKIKAQTKASLAFGLYVNLEGDQDVQIRKQLAYARVITDKVSFSFICDVIVHDKFRRRGLGTKLMDVLLMHADVRSTIKILGTKEAYRFYEKFGFGPPAAPMMQCDPMKVMGQIR